MTDHIDQLLVLTRDHIRARVADGSLRRMIVNSIEPDGSLVLREVGTGTIHEEPYRALAGPSSYLVDDYVLVGEVMGRGSATGVTRVVLGKFGNNSPQTITDAASASTSTTPSTSNVTTYQDALTLSLALPAGTWTVTAHGGLALSHSVNQANWRIEIDGNAPTGHTLSLVTEQQVMAAHRRTGVAGGRTIAIKVQMKSLTAGTTTARNPHVMVTAVRTA